MRPTRLRLGQHMGVSTMAHVYAKKPGSTPDVQESEPSQQPQLYRDKAAACSSSKALPAPELGRGPSCCSPFPRGDLLKHRRNTATSNVARAMSSDAPCCHLVVPLRPRALNIFVLVKTACLQWLEGPTAHLRRRLIDRTTPCKKLLRRRKPRPYHRCWCGPMQAVHAKSRRFQIFFLFVLVFLTNHRRENIKKL